MEGTILGEVVAPLASQGCTVQGNDDIVASLLAMSGERGRMSAFAREAVARYVAEVPDVVPDFRRPGDTDKAKVTLDPSSFTDLSLRARREGRLPGPTLLAALGVALGVEPVVTLHMAPRDAPSAGPTTL
jgi:hypothetical protein